MIIFLTKALETTFSIYFCLVLKVVPYKVFLMYIFKAKIAFSDHAFPGLKTVQSKMPRKASVEEALNSNSLSFMSEHLLKRIKPSRIVYLKSGLQDFRLSEGKHQPILKDEISSAINNLKNEKSPGLDNIYSEYIKCTIFSIAS